MHSRLLHITLSTSLFLSLFSESFSVGIKRGPYLQSVTDHSAIVCFWPEDTAGIFLLEYGTSADACTGVLIDSTASAFRTIQLENLSADTKYYYSIRQPGDTVNADPEKYFQTPVQPEDTSRIRFWVTGDFGRGNNIQIQVRNAYMHIHQSDPAGAWLWLGDNAYNDGSFANYDDYVFSERYGYRSLLKQLGFFAVPGNHDYNSIQLTDDFLVHNGPYYELVVNPQNGECGGEPSNTELYYSFDYGNVHVITLNTNVLSLFTDKQNRMVDWVRADLKKNKLKWVVVMTHHPPYSKGSHNSDNFSVEKASFYLREKFLPLFDSMGVDLFLSGHSHNYERSYLIHGHYGRSETYNPELHLISGLSGNKDLGEAYVKKHKGTIYAIVGNSGATSADNNILHPVMYIDYAGSYLGGSMIIDIQGDELTGTYINQEGSIIDRFTIVKQVNINTSNEDFTNQQNQIDLGIFPNPSTDKMSLQCYAQEAGIASLQIISANGSLLNSRLLGLVEGNNLIDLPEWPQLPAGIYIIRLQLNGMVYSEKAIKLQ